MPGRIGVKLRTEYKMLPRHRVKDKAFQADRTVHLKGHKKPIDWGVFEEMKDGGYGVCVRETLRRWGWSRLCRVLLPG